MSENKLKLQADVYLREYRIIEQSEEYVHVLLLKTLNSERIYNKLFKNKIFTGNSILKNEIENNANITSLICKIN